MLVLRLLMPAVEGLGKKAKAKAAKEGQAVNGTGQEEQQATVAGVRALWLRPVAQALLHSQRSARTRIADHLLQVRVFRIVSCVLNRIGLSY